MTPVALLLEIEEIVFDTRLIRATSLATALRDEGVIVALDAVLEAHAGCTAVMALDALQTPSLDPLGRELVLRRASDAVRRAFDEGLPSFDTPARDTIERLSTELLIGVVSRAGSDDAARMLQHAALDMCVRTVQSLGNLAPADHHSVWSRAASKLLGAQAFAVVPAQLAAGPRAAGIRTITVGTPNGGDSGATLVSMARPEASFVASLSALSG